MLLTLPQLKALVAALEGARARSANSGDGDYCTAPNTDADGNDWRWEPKPNARQLPGHVYPDGTALEVRAVEGPNGLVVAEKGIMVPFGAHGRAHLAIDPGTGKVRCAKCAEAKR